jgi:hypothetical protein
MFENFSLCLFLLTFFQSTEKKGKPFLKNKTHNTESRWIEDDSKPSGLYIISMTFSA